MLPASLMPFFYFQCLMNVSSLVLYKDATNIRILIEKKLIQIFSGTLICIVSFIRYIWTSICVNFLLTEYIWIFVCEYVRVWNYLKIFKSIRIFIELSIQIFSQTFVQAWMLVQQYSYVRSCNFLIQIYSDLCHKQFL